MGARFVTWGSDIQPPAPPPPQAAMKPATVSARLFFNNEDLVFNSEDLVFACEDLVFNSEDLECEDKYKNRSCMSLKAVQVREWITCRGI